MTDPSPELIDNAKTVGAAAMRYALNGGGSPTLNLYEAIVICTMMLIGAGMDPEFPEQAVKDGVKTFREQAN